LPLYHLKKIPFQKSEQVLKKYYIPQRKKMDGWMDGWMDGNIEAGLDNLRS
jgi:hypothetical protein